MPQSNNIYKDRALRILILDAKLLFTNWCLKWHQGTNTQQCIHRHNRADYEHDDWATVTDKNT